MLLEGMPEIVPVDPERVEVDHDVVEIDVLLRSSVNQAILN